MDSKTVLRLGAAGLLRLALFGATFALHGRDAAEPIRVFPAIVPADPLAAEAHALPKAGSRSRRQSRLRRGMGREPRPVLLAAQRVHGALRMGGSGVIDQFLNVFTTYIDSGFGLLGGDVRFLSQTLIALDITVAGLF